MKLSSLLLLLISLASLCCIPGVALAAEDEFCFGSPGVLDPLDKAVGRLGDRFVYVPDMVFPLVLVDESGAGPGDAFLNSQIFGVGGAFGDSPNKNVNSADNYVYCWEDTYCEGKRSWNMPLCPSGIGHQGNDIRPNSPKNKHFEAVAFADGEVTLVTNNTTVQIRADDGTSCRYLHLEQDSIKLNTGDRVSAGKTVIGRVSNIMGGKPNTSIHLHFDCEQRVKIGTKIRRMFVPVYTSLLAAFSRAKSLGLEVESGRLKQGNKAER